MLSISRIRLLCFLLAAAGSLDATLGADLYIAPAPAGSDANNCTESTPCATPARGIALMNDGDTLWIADGTYTNGVGPGGGCASSTQIYVGPSKDCPEHGCAIRAQNVTNPPSVTFVGGQAGVVINGASNWTIQGIETSALFGILECGSSHTTYQDLRLISTGTTTINLLTGGSDSLLERIETYREGKPCELSPVDSGKAIAVKDMQNVTISESYLGHVFALMVLTRVDGFTLKRSHVQHWANHGIVMREGVRNVLIENNIIGGSGRTECQNANVVGPRLMDLYEVTNLTIRNNSIVGHGYSPRSAMISYFQFGNTYAGCDLSPAQPGFCEFDTSVVCTANDIPKITGVAYSATSSECPNRVGADPWSPRQRCSGVCELHNVKTYNNIVYDLRNTGEVEAGTRYVDWLSQGVWSVTTNLRFDGNYYSGGVERWICAGSNGNKESLEDWRTSQCEGGPNPDAHSVSGHCSNTQTLACGGGADCPGSETCIASPPLFVNYGGEDYRPAPGAIQIDAGVNGTDAQGVARCALEDFDGNPRDDGACDIGAYEATAGSSDDSVLPQVPGQVLNPSRTDTTR